MLEQKGSWDLNASDLEILVLNGLPSSVDSACCVSAELFIEPLRDLIEKFEFLLGSEDDVFSVDEGVIAVFLGFRAKYFG